MPPSDLVPCFYTGQNYLRDQPAEKLPRAAVREYKRQKLGKFIASGKYFLFHARHVAKQVAAKLWDGPLGTGMALPFSKPRSSGDRLHYEIPMAGDVGIYRHFSGYSPDDAGILRLTRHKISVSHRVPDEVVAQQAVAAFNFRVRLRMPIAISA